MADTKTPAMPKPLGQLRTLEEINPLISGGGWNNQTAENIRCALEFLADAIPGAMGDEGSSNTSAFGAYLVLRTCAVAIEVCHAGGEVSA